MSEMVELIERCDREGLTPGGKMVTTRDGRLLHFPASFIVLHQRVLRAEVRSARVMRRWFRDSAKDATQAGKVTRELLDEYTEEALAAFLAIEKGGLA